MITINSSIEWVLKYVKGLNDVNSINESIESDLQNNFGWIPNKYGSFYDEFGVLFRGLYFKDEASLKSFLEKIDSNGCIKLKCSSWTEDNIVAQNFMNGEGFNHYNKDNIDKDEIFSIKISCEVPQENILFSYLTFGDYLKNTNINYLEELEILTNESEFLIKEDIYKIEIDMATTECKKLFNKILGVNHCSIKYTEFV